MEYEDIRVKIFGILDTGASVSIIPFQTFRKFWPTLSLKSADVELTNFDGSRILGLQGQFQATVTYNSRSAIVQLYVLESTPTTVWGLDVAESLIIDIRKKTINSLLATVVKFLTQVTDPSTIVQEFLSLITSGIGKFPNFEH